jgi:protein AroM
MKKEQVEIILMDCMGYVEEMRNSLQEITKTPVILSNTIMAKIISEIIT